MPHLLRMLVKGKKYFYLAKSIRMPDGSQKKLYKFLGSKKPHRVPASAGFFEKKEQEVLLNFAAKKYANDKIITDAEIKKIELMRLGYKKIMRRLSKKQVKDMLDRFAVNFTYESNALEGNSLTLKDVAIVIFENISIRGKELREIYEARNSRRVIELIFKKKFQISHESIIKIHKILMRDIDTATGYKKIPNFILGRNVETTPPEKVLGEMDRLISWYNSNMGRLHPIVLASIFHGRFEKIHPFEDGNGRVGRFLVNVILTSAGYPPLIIRRTTRTAYMSCPSAFDNSHYDNLKRFFLEKFKDTYRKFFEVYVKYV